MLTTSILSSDASDFFALAFALAVMDKTAVVTWERKKKKKKRMRCLYSSKTQAK